MPINAVLDISVEESLYPVTEPVTVDEVKAYAKIDFNDEDDLLASLITAAREKLEKYMGVSIVQKFITATLRNECGGIEIPYGPTPDTIDVALIVDENGNAFDPSNIKIIGTNFKYLESPVSCYVQMMYVAGYVPTWQALTEGGVPLPEAIRLGIMAQVFFDYENRSEKLSFGSGGVRSYDVLYICDGAKQFCNKYKRNIELSL